jgi:hypothetical protein
LLSEVQAEQILKAQNSNLPVRLKVLLIDTETVPVMVELVSNAMVMLDIGPDGSALVFGVFPEELRKPRETILNCIDILPWHAHDGS